MKITKWEPEKELAWFKKSFDRLFEDFFGSEITTYTPLKFPPMDISEDKEAFKVKIDLPGFHKDDIQVSIEENILTIKGKREAEKETKDKNILRSERYYGEFTRSINLPPTILADKIGAEYKNGVLTLIIPKREEAKAKTIKIDVVE